MLVGDGPQRVVIARLPGVVHGDNRLRVRRDLGFDLCWIEQQRIRVNVGKDRRASLKNYAIGTGSKGNAGNLVIRSVS